MYLLFFFFIFSLNLFSHYIDDLLNQPNDDLANEALLQNLKNNKDDLSFIEQGLSTKFYEKGYIKTLRNMMRNGAFFDVREIKFKEYILAMKNLPAARPDPSQWKFHATYDSNSGAYTLDTHLDQYVENNWKYFHRYAKPSDKIKYNWSSNDTVLVLRNTNEFPLVENAVFKIMGKDKKRAFALSDARDDVINLDLKRIIVPNFVRSSNKSVDSHYIFEERMDTDANFYFQKNLYGFLYEKARSDTELRENISAALKELTEIVCNSGYDDIKFDNNPIIKEGYIALIDPESVGTNEGPKRLLENAHDFYTSSFSKEIIKNTIGKYQDFMGQCEREKYDISDINLEEVKIAADVLQDSFEQAHRCQMRKGIIDNTEPVYDDMLLQKDFQNEENYKIAKYLLDHLKNNDTNNIRSVEQGYSIESREKSAFPSGRGKENEYVDIFKQLINKNYICSLTDFDMKTASKNSDIYRAKNIFY